MAITLRHACMSWSLVGIAPQTPPSLSYKSLSIKNVYSAASEVTNALPSKVILDQSKFGALRVGLQQRCAAIRDIAVE
jgi:hypothetical protein